MKILARKPRQKPTYISYDKFDMPSPGKLRTTRQASIRLEFRTPNRFEIK
jgi:hypothetical protein